MWQFFSGRNPWVKDAQDGCMRYNPDFMSEAAESEALAQLPQFRLLAAQ